MEVQKRMQGTVKSAYERNWDGTGGVEVYFWITKNEGKEAVPCKSVTQGKKSFRI